MHRTQSSGLTVCSEASLRRVRPYRRKGAGYLIRAIVLAGAMVLAGCGFHLRGDVVYPPAMAVTYIEATDLYTPFYRQLKATLRHSGVQVSADPTAAGAVLRILADDYGQRVVAVSARNTPTEYQVYYLVRYALDIGGSQALPPQELSLARDYNYDETQVLGKAAEADSIRDALAGDLVGTITRRLSSVR